MGECRVMNARWAALPLLLLCLTVAADVPDLVARLKDPAAATREERSLSSTHEQHTPLESLTDHEMHETKATIYSGPTFEYSLH